MTTDPPATDRRELAAAVYAGSPDPILVLTDDGIVLEANDPARAAFGDDVVGTSFGIPTAPGGSTEVELVGTGGPRVAELRIGTAGLQDGQVHVAVLRDVTERKTVVQALRDFVSTASHEFRTPIMTIQGFCEVLTGHWEELDDEERLQHLTVIHRQSTRLSRLTNDLLALARLESEVEPTPQLLHPEVVVGRVLDVADLDQVDVGIEDGVRVWADPDDLEDVLTNLVGNAEKYGQPPYQVHVTREGDEAVLRVVDHGDGVPPEFRHRLFERFARALDARKKAGGTGLGLAIAAGRVGRNGGTLSHETTPGGGATFVVRLPAERP